MTSAGRFGASTHRTSFACPGRRGYPPFRGDGRGVRSACQAGFGRDLSPLVVHRHPDDVSDVRRWWRLQRAEVEMVPDLADRDDFGDAGNDLERATAAFADERIRLKDLGDEPHPSWASSGASWAAAGRPRGSPPLPAAARHARGWRSGHRSGCDAGHRRSKSLRCSSTSRQSGHSRPRLGLQTRHVISTRYTGAGPSGVTVHSRSASTSAARVRSRPRTSSAPAPRLQTRRRNRHPDPRPRLLRSSRSGDASCGARPAAFPAGAKAD